MSTSNAADVIITSQTIVYNLTDKTRIRPTLKKEIEMRALEDDRTSQIEKNLLYDTDTHVILVRIRNDETGRVLERIGYRNWPH